MDTIFLGPAMMAPILRLNEGLEEGERGQAELQVNREEK